MSHLLRIWSPMIVLVSLLSGPTPVMAQQVPNVPSPRCAYCGTPLPNGVHSPSCPYYNSGAKSDGSKARSPKPGLTSRDINTMVAATLFESLLASTFADSGASEQEALAAREKAIALARQQAAWKQAREAAAQAEHDRMMKSYKQLDGTQNTGFKTLSDSTVDFKTLDGDMETMAAGARKPFDTAGTLKTPEPNTIRGGTPFFGDTMPAPTLQFLVQPENDPNVVDLRNAQTYVVQNLKKDSNDLEASATRYDKDKEKDKPVVRPPDCVKRAQKLKVLIQQRKYFQKTIDLAQEQLTTWQDANRNALLNAAKDGLDWYAGYLLDRLVKRGQAAVRLQRICERNAAQMAREGINVAEVQAKIERLKVWSAAGRLADLANNVKDWQTFIKDGASALVKQLTASNEEIEQMLEDPRMKKYFETEAPELKALLDITKIAASNKVFGKWLARKIPVIAGVELAINESYNALDWYLSYRRLAEAQGINGHVLEAAQQLQRQIDDASAGLKECP